MKGGKERERRVCLCGLLRGAEPSNPNPKKRNGSSFKEKVCSDTSVMGTRFFHTDFFSSIPENFHINFLLIQLFLI